MNVYTSPDHLDKQPNDFGELFNDDFMNDFKKINLKSGGVTIPPSNWSVRLTRTAVGLESIFESVLANFGQYLDVESIENIEDVKQSFAFKMLKNMESFVTNAPEGFEASGYFQNIEARKELHKLLLDLIVLVETAKEKCERSLFTAVALLDLNNRTKSRERAKKLLKDQSGKV
jgi:hypothetical protein